MSKNISIFLSAITNIFIIVFIISQNPACAKQSDTKSQKVKSESGIIKNSTDSLFNKTSQSEKQDTTQSTQVKTNNSKNILENSSEKKNSKTIDVYLFHGTYRCFSCNLMEELTKQAIDEQLGKEKQSGIVVFHHINVEEPQNQHFIQDYRLVAISIILSQKLDGKEKQWKNLDKVWEYLREPNMFKEYVITEIKNYLKG